MEEGFVRSGDWVVRITGETEIDFRKNKEQLLREQPSLYATPEMIIINKNTQEEFSCGCLEMISLGELRKFKQKSKEKVIFDIIVRDDKESIDQVNVATLQAMKEYNNSVFLVASNFNGVESVSEFRSPNEQNFTTNYIYDLTQGPIASLGAPGACLQRTIFPFYDKSVEPTEWEQSKEKQIEMLKELNDIYHVKNGYPLLKKDIREPKDEEKEKYIGVIHSNVEISYIYLGNGFKFIEKEERNRIDQVFAAAVNVGQGSSGYTNYVLCSSKRKVISFALECGYETCYLAAIKNRRKTIVLTLLGGGVFGNYFVDICESIVKIHKEYGMGNNGELRRVVLPIFSVGGGEVVDIMSGLLKKNKIPFRILHYKNNKLTEN